MFVYILKSYTHYLCWKVRFQTRRAWKIFSFYCNLLTTRFNIFALWVVSYFYRRKSHSRDTLTNKTGSVWMNYDRCVVTFLAFDIHTTLMQVSVLNILSNDYTIIYKRNCSTVHQRTETWQILWQISQYFLKTRYKRACLASDCHK